MDELLSIIIENAIKKHVTDIHILLSKEGKIHYRENGHLSLVRSESHEQGKKLLNYIRYLANIDINYSYTPQTGRIEYKYRNHIYYLRVSSLPAKDIDSIVIRILNNQETKKDLNNLLRDQKTLNYLKTMIHQNAGLFIVSGPTGSGKSTTLYTLLDAINSIEKRNIVTLEDPIEIQKDFCLQIQINNQLGINYQNSLRQILRHDPDVIMIGEIRDSDTAKLAITCALTGHLVLTTIHSSNCINTLKRLTNLGITPLDLDDVLIGVMSQQMKYDIHHQPLVLTEFIDQKNIHDYLEGKPIHFSTFHHQIEEYRNKGLYEEE